MKKIINIVVNFDNNFLNMAIVFFVSMMKKSSSEYNYEVYILTNNLSEKSYLKLCVNLSEYDNLHFHKMDLGYILNKNEFAREWRADTIVNYCRLFIPELFPDMDRCLYIDVDMIVNRGIEELYNINMKENCYLAAVSGYATRGIPSKKDQEYIRSIIPDIVSMENYFNDGLFLLNIKKIREDGFYDKKMVLKKCAEKLLFADQDILNILYCSHVQYLDVRWNVGMIKNYDGLDKVYADSCKDPFIIHYNGFKRPTKYVDVKLQEYFWNVARETMIYEELLLDLMGNNINQYIDNLEWKKVFKGFLNKLFKRK